jgi:hypothetical protein
VVQLFCPRFAAFAVNMGIQLTVHPEVKHAVGMCLLGDLGSCYPVAL